MSTATAQEGREGDREARQRLLASATEIFTRKGYAAATVREIVTGAGVTAPVLYYYFGNKEGLFLALMKDAWEQFEAVIAAALGEGGSARARIVRLCDRVFSLFRERIGTARVMYSIYYGPREGSPRFDCDAYHDRFREVISELLDEGVRGQEFRPRNRDDAMWALVGALNIAMEVELCHPELAFGSEGLTRVLDTIFRGVGSPGSPVREERA